MSYKTYFNWSTGKDSALALYKTLQNPLFDIAALVTTVNSDMERVSMHGLRNGLLLKQAKSIEIPLKIISRNYSYKIIPISWYGRKKGTAKFKIKELRSKYLFTLIYCFIERNLLNIKK